jgi:hypothetical protein
MKTIKTLTIGLAAVALLALSPSLARASLFWNFSYVDTGTGGSLIQASGTLTTADVLTAGIGTPDAALQPYASGYQITGMTGQRNGVAITGIVPSPNFPNEFQNGNLLLDNGLLTVAPWFDWDGFVFTVAGGAQYNLSSQLAPHNPPTIDYTVAGGAFLPVTFSISQVPEPTTMVAGALLLLPFGASTLRMFRKTRTA